MHTVIFLISTHGRPGIWLVARRGMKWNSNFNLLSWANKYSSWALSPWSSEMPNSKRRKRLVASNKKQIERARRRIEAKTRGEADKENVTSDTAFLKESSSSCKTSSDSFEEEPHRRTDQQKEQVSDIYESTTGWLGGLYSWCHSGLVQVWRCENDPLPSYHYDNVYALS